MGMGVDLTSKRHDAAGSILLKMTWWKNSGNRSGDIV